MDQEKRRLNVDVQKYFSDANRKLLAYLFTAHGAGVVGCLSLLKDYNAVPQYKGVGYFLAIFAIGMVMTTVSWVAENIADTAEMLDIIEVGERKIELTKANAVFFFSSLIAALLFISALFGLAWRFMNL
ncbi:MULTISPECIES: hypothetical protein [unclassified Bradyrhizobium]